jgi:hypothetical protein
MRDKLAAIARANGRSMTAEVVHRLEQSFERETSGEVPDFRTSLAVDAIFEMRDMLAAMANRVDNSALSRLPPIKKPVSRK